MTTPVDALACAWVATARFVRRERVWLVLMALAVIGMLA